MDYTAYFTALTECSPSAPSAPLNLSDPGAAEGFVNRAGLEVVERGEHDVVCLYRSSRDAIDALESAGPAWAAIDHAGPERARAAIEGAFAPFTNATSGTTVMRAKMGHLLARKT